MIDELKIRRSPDFLKEPPPHQGPVGGVDPKRLGLLFAASAVVSLIGLALVIRSSNLQNQLETNVKGRTLSDESINKVSVIES